MLHTTSSHLCFFFNDTATTEIYTLSLHDALPISIYNALRGLQGQAQWTTLELASDQARADTREPNLGTSGPDFLIWDASTGNTGAYWGTAYSIITRANLVLANGPGIDAPNAQIGR